MNHEFEDIDSFVDFLEEKGQQQLVAMNETAAVSTGLLFHHAYEMYGKNPPLADLAQSTQDERVKLGFTPNDPLLRDGHLLRDKLEANAVPSERIGVNDVASANVGTPEIINLYHEHGYINARTGRPVPARPVFLITAQETQENLAELYSGEVKRVFAS